MAQANSAQREPSMEEILASIRRIIEDSDTASDPAKETAAADESVSTAEAEPVRSAGVVEVESFRADLRASAEAYETPKEEPSLRFADVQAKVKLASASVEDEQVEATFAGLKNPRIAAAAEAAAEPTEDGGLDQDEMIAELSEQLGALNVFEPEEKKTAEAKPAILSEETGRQVAASFGELSEAFSTNRRRSFEEIAEEMMRPMLQDWLDNNLPVLVERLVREEIERVARGAGG